jgi:hypothetical protein
LLLEVRTKDNWNEWIMYILEAVVQTSKETVLLVNDISELIKKTKYEIQEKFPKIYSKFYINLELFDRLKKGYNLK